MADISVTAANVRPLNGAIVRRCVAGGTITPGQVVYINGSGQAVAADANAVGTAKGRGIVLGGSSGAVSFASGSTVDLCVYGPVEGFAGMTPDAPEYVSETAGALADTAPSTSSAVVWAMGRAESATVFFVDPGLDVTPQAAIATLTDSSGGTANDTITALGGITTLTDNTGYSGTHDDTLAATAALTTLTDNTGGSGSHDDTLAAITAAAGTLGGTADGTLETVGSTSGGDVSGAIMNNFQDLLAAVIVLKQNQSDVGQKVIELVTRDAVHAQNASDIGQKVIELVADMDDAKNNFADLAAKVNAILAVLRKNALIAN